MPPKQTQQPLPLLLSPSFFYGEFSMANTLYNPCTHCTVGHTIIYTMKRQMSSALYAQTTFAFSSQIFLLSIQNSLLTIFTKLPLINTYILYCTSTWVQNYLPPSSSGGSAFCRGITSLPAFTHQANYRQAPANPVHQSQSICKYTVSEKKFFLFSLFYFFIPF